MQAMSRVLGLLALFFGAVLPMLAAPLNAQPLSRAMEAVRAGDWDAAQGLAAPGGPVAADIVMWHLLRAGRGSAAETEAFLTRRPDWPGEAYLRRRSEPAYDSAKDTTVLGFFAQTPPQTPQGVLNFAARLLKAGDTDQARARLRAVWLEMPMTAREHAAFLKDHASLLKPLHSQRLTNMLWNGRSKDIDALIALAPSGEAALARARQSLQRFDKNPNALIDKVPTALAGDAGLNHDRFQWRARKSSAESAKALILATSTSAEALGQPQAWSNRRRSLARDEMRDGDARRAYQLAARHFLASGSAYADLEWLAGYIALRKLGEPGVALKHFQNHRSAIESPISRGRAGYWIGRAYEAMGDAPNTEAAYADGAQFQTSFYGLLAAERAGLPFDDDLEGIEGFGDWKASDMAKDPLFEAGKLLLDAGELSLAERFWTHYAERLDRRAAGQLGQAAIDQGQPHIAVMIGKRVAQRGIVLPGPYYALHPVAKRDLPMAPEMTLAIARRESEFDPSVISGAGARGLMQIMPATAKEVARDLGRAGEHATSRLTADPTYNADLGTYFLAQLAGRFDGNVVLMSAAYNAGPSRPIRWTALYGDPRKGTADFDVIDWIEHIPFRETRNYVMRVTESLPIYRARLGLEPLAIPFEQELTGSTLLSFAPKGE